MNLFKTELEAMCSIADEAAEAIMSIYDSEFDVELKIDDSPLTLADLKADQIIRERLTRFFPGIPIVSEESTSTMLANDEPATFFLIDPLDGTKEFIKRNGEFTVNIALIHERRSIAGVVHAPALGVMYFAGDGLGAWRRTSVTESIRVAARNDERPLRVISSRSHAVPEMEAWLAALGCDYSLATVGSSLKFCKIAEGSANVYPRLAPTNQWDTAAAQNILEVAGGSVCSLDGMPLAYGLHRPLLNPSFIACGARHWL